MSELQQPESNTDISQQVSAQTPSQIAAALQREQTEWVTEITTALGETTVEVPRENIVALIGGQKRSRAWK
jgi:hypothetical protein